MPVSLLNTDTSFPSFQKDTPTAERVEVLTDYLYMLLEELRYTFNNLGAENFNDNGLEELAININKPVLVRIEDAEKGVAEVKTTAEEISTKMESVEGDVSSVKQTVNSLSSTVSSFDGRITSISQSLDSISLGVTNGEFSSTIKLYKDGVAVSSQIVSFEGVVTFSDLERKGQTVINGGNITTGTISAISIDACDISSSVFSTLLDTDGSVGGEVKFYYMWDDDENYLAGGIRLDDEGAGTIDETQFRMFIYTNDLTYRGAGPFSIKMRALGKISVEGRDYLYLYSGANLTVESEVDMALRSYQDMELRSSGDLTIRSGSSGGIYLVGDVYVNGILIS